jgi:putative transposase
MMLARKKNRLTAYDYSSAGCYFVTINTFNGYSHFGSFSGQAIILSRIGIIVNNLLKCIPKIHNKVYLESFIIMPDHIHAIIRILPFEETGHFVKGANFAPFTISDTGNDRSKMLLSKVIQQFKRACTLEINRQHLFRGKIWQRSFFDRIIRDKNELFKAKVYIKNNPVKWIEKKGI